MATRSRKMSIVEIGALNMNPDGDYKASDLMATREEAAAVVADSKWRARKPKFNSADDEATVGTFDNTQKNLVSALRKAREAADKTTQDDIKKRMKTSQELHRLKYRVNFMLKEFELQQRNITFSNLGIDPDTTLDKSTVQVAREYIDAIKKAVGDATDDHDVLAEERETLLHELTRWFLTHNVTNPEGEEDREEGRETEDLDPDVESLRHTDGVMEERYSAVMDAVDHTKAGRITLSHKHRGILQVIKTYYEQTLARLMEETRATGLQLEERQETIAKLTVRNDSLEAEVTMVKAEFDRAKQEVYRKSQELLAYKEKARDVIDAVEMKAELMIKEQKFKDSTAILEGKMRRMEAENEAILLRNSEFEKTRIQFTDEINELTYKLEMLELQHKQVTGDRDFIKEQRRVEGEVYRETLVKQQAAASKERSDLQLSYDEKMDKLGAYITDLEQQRDNNEADKHQVKVTFQSKITDLEEKLWALREKHDELQSANFELKMKMSGMSDTASITSGGAGSVARAPKKSLQPAPNASPRAASRTAASRGSVSGARPQSPRAPNSRLMSVDATSMSLQTAATHAAATAERARRDDDLASIASDDTAGGSSYSMAHPRAPLTGFTRPSMTFRPSNVFSISVPDSPPKADPVPTVVERRGSLRGGVPPPLEKSGSGREGADSRAAAITSNAPTGGINRTGSFRAGGSPRASSPRSSPRASKPNISRSASPRGSFRLSSVDAEPMAQPMVAAANVSSLESLTERARAMMAGRTSSSRFSPKGGTRSSLGAPGVPPPDASNVYAIGQMKRLNEELERTNIRLAEDALTIKNLTEKLSLLPPELLEDEVLLKSLLQAHKEIQTAEITLVKDAEFHTEAKIRLEKLQRDSSLAVGGQLLNPMDRAIIKFISKEANTYKAHADLYSSEKAVMEEQINSLKRRLATVEGIALRDETTAQRMSDLAKADAERVKDQRLILSAHEDEKRRLNLEITALKGTNADMKEKVGNLQEAIRELEKQLVAGNLAVHTELDEANEEIAKMKVRLQASTMEVWQQTIRIKALESKPNLIKHTATESIGSPTANVLKLENLENRLRIEKAGYEQHINQLESLVTELQNNLKSQSEANAVRSQRIKAAHDAEKAKLTSDAEELRKTLRETSDELLVKENVISRLEASMENTALRSPASPGPGGAISSSTTADEDLTRARFTLAINRASFAAQMDGMKLRYTKELRESEERLNDVKKGIIADMREIEKQYEERHEYAVNVLTSLTKVLDETKEKGRRLASAFERQEIVMKGLINAASRREREASDDPSIRDLSSYIKKFEHQHARELADMRRLQEKHLEELHSSTEAERDSALEMAHQYQKLNQDRIVQSFENMWNLKVCEKALNVLKESTLKTDDEKNMMFRMHKEFRGTMKEMTEGSNWSTLGKRYVQRVEVATQTVAGPLPGRVIGRGNLLKQQAMKYESDLRKLKVEYEETLRKAVRLQPLASTTLLVKSLHPPDRRPDQLQYLATGLVFRSMAEKIIMKKCEAAAEILPAGSQLGPVLLALVKARLRKAQFWNEKHRQLMLSSRPASAPWGTQTTETNVIEPLVKRGLCPPIDNVLSEPYNSASRKRWGDRDSEGDRMLREITDRIGAVVVRDGSTSVPLRPTTAPTSHRVNVTGFASPRTRGINASARISEISPDKADV